MNMKRCVLSGGGEAVHEVHRQGVQSQEDAVAETVWRVWGQDKRGHQVSCVVCVCVFILTYGHLLLLGAQRMHC